MRPSVLSRHRHQAGVCLSEHLSADRSERACGPDDCEHRALPPRCLGSTEVSLEGANADGCLPEQPVSTRGPEQRDAVQGALRQGCLPRHLRVIGSRAFVHHESTALGKDALSGTAWTASRIGSTTPKGDVRESRNVIFTETASVMPPPDVGGYDDEEFTYGGLDDMMRDVRN